MNQNNLAISIENLSVYLGKNPVLWEIGLSIPKGKCVGIIGPNGAGKSTLLKSLIGIVKPISGEILFFGLPYKKVRERIAYVPQRESIDWDFPVRVIDVALMGCYARQGFFRWPGRKDKKRALAMLERLGIAGLAHRQIGELSGGQQQRLFLARALLQEADIILLDEPFSGVDVPTEKLIIDLIKSLNLEGKTVLMVHHDLNSVKSYFDWAIFLNRRLIAAGDVKEVFTQENLQRTYGNMGSLLEEAAKLHQEKVRL